MTVERFLAEPLHGTTWGQILGVVAVGVTPLCLLLTWLLNLWQARRKVRRDDFTAFTNAMRQQHHGLLDQATSQQRQIDRQERRLVVVAESLKQCKAEHEKCHENLASVNAQLDEVRTGLAEVKKNGNGGH